MDDELRRDAETAVARALDVRYAPLVWAGVILDELHEAGFRVSRREAGEPLEVVASTEKISDETRAGMVAVTSTPYGPGVVVGEAREPTPGATR